LVGKWGFSKAAIANEERDGTFRNKADNYSADVRASLIAKAVYVLGAEKVIILAPGFLNDFRARKGRFDGRNFNGGCGGKGVGFFDCRCPF